MRRFIFAAFAAAAGVAFGALVLAEGLREAWPLNVNSAFHMSLGATLLVQAACLALLAWSAPGAWRALAYVVAGAALSLATAFGSEILGPLALAVFVVATAVLALRAADGMSRIAQIR